MCHAGDQHPKKQYMVFSVGKQNQSKNKAIVRIQTQKHFLDIQDWTKKIVQAGFILSFAPISDTAAAACFFKHIIITKQYGFSQRERIPLESETIRVPVG